VEQPSVEDAIAILTGLKSKYEDHHKAEFTSDAVEACVKLSDRYITARFLPDKAIDVLDEAGSKARIGAMQRPPNIKEIEAEIESLRQKKEQAIKDQDFEGAAQLRDHEKSAKERLEKTLADWKIAKDEKRVVVTEDDILQVVAKWTGIPLKRMGQSDMQKLLAIEDELPNWLSVRKMLLRRSPRHCVAPEPTSRILSARSAVLLCWARPASERRCWLARWLSRCSAAIRPSSNSTCLSTWRSTMCRAWSALLPDTSDTKKAVSSLNASVVVRTR